jgi:hypothetical protein
LMYLLQSLCAGPNVWIVLHKAATHVLDALAASWARIASNTDSTFSIFVSAITLPFLRASPHILPIGSSTGAAFASAARFNPSTQSW